MCLSKQLVRALRALHVPEIGMGQGTPDFLVGTSPGTVLNQFRALWLLDGGFRLCILHSRVRLTKFDEIPITKHGHGAIHRRG